MSFIINNTSGGLNRNIKLDEGFSLFMGNSGIGKTLLFDIIMSYCHINKIPYSYFNSYTLDTFSKSSMIESCRNKEIVLMDNADLYLTKDMLDKIKSLGAKYILISKKSMYGLFNMDNKFKTYDVIFDGINLSTKEY